MLKQQEINELVIKDDNNIRNLSIAFNLSLNKSTKELVTIIKNQKINNIKTLKNILGVKFLEQYKVFYNSIIDLHKSLMENIGVTEKYKELNLIKMYLRQYEVNTNSSKKFLTEIINLTFKDLNITEELDIEDIEKNLKKYLKRETKSAVNTKMYSEISLMSTYRNQNLELAKELNIKKLRMYGVLDGRTSSICRHNIKKLKTDTQWKKVNPNYINIGLHIKCRHTFLPDF